MNYAMRVVSSNPEGATEAIEYWMANTEDEMEAMLEAQKDVSCCGITCLGPVTEPSKFMQVKISDKKDKILSRRRKCE